MKWKGPDGKEQRHFGGAVFEPNKIRASAEAPDDFDQFWSEKIKELDSVDMDVKLEKVDIGDEKIEYYKIEMNNIRGRKIYGQLAKPIGEAKYQPCYKSSGLGCIHCSPIGSDGTPAMDGWH